MLPRQGGVVRKNACFANVLAQVCGHAENAKEERKNEPKAKNGRAQTNVLSELLFAQGEKKFKKKQQQQKSWTTSEPRKKRKKRKEGSFFKTEARLRNPSQTTTLRFCFQDKFGLGRAARRV